MKIPDGVRQATQLIWWTLGVSALLTLAEKLLGVIDFGYFVSSLFFTALFGIFPYKLERGSNAARYIYAVLMVLTYLLMLGSAEYLMVPKPELVLSALLVPVEIFIFMRLFSAQAGEWFGGAAKWL